MKRRGHLLSCVCALAVMMVGGAVSTLAAGSIDFWTQYATQPYLIEAAEEFTRQTGIQVNLRAITFDTDTLFVAIAADAAPDLFTHGGAALGTFASQSILTPLEPIMAEWSFADDFIPEALEYGQYEGEQLALPFIGIAVRDLVYRVDAFEESGLNADHPPERWDDLVDYGRKLVRYNENGEMTRNAITIDRLAGEQLFLMYLHQQGARLIEDGHSTLNGEEALRALTFIADMYFTHRLTEPNFWGNIQDGTSVMEWNTMQLFSDRVIAQLGRPDLLRVATYPYAEVPATFGAVDFIALPKGAKNREEAIRFLEFLLSPEQQYKIVRATGMLPFYREAATWDWVQDSPVLFHYMAALSYAVPNPAHEHWFEMRQYLREAVRTATDPSDRVTPQAALERAHGFVERVLQ